MAPFANPHLVSGWMRGSHNGRLMRCALGDATPARFDGPPRVVGMGFQLADGRVLGPRDMCGDVSFDRARRQALEMADYMRRNGPFEPGRVPRRSGGCPASPRGRRLTAASRSRLVRRL